MFATKLSPLFSDHLRGVKIMLILFFCCNMWSSKWMMKKLHAAKNLFGCVILLTCFRHGFFEIWLNFCVTEKMCLFESHIFSYINYDVECAMYADMKFKCRVKLIKNNEIFMKSVISYDKAGNLFNHLIKISFYRKVYSVWWLMYKYNPFFYHTNSMKCSVVTVLNRIKVWS